MTLSDTKSDAFSPQIALDSHGDAVAAWASFDGSEYSIEAATESGLDGSWAAPVTLARLGAEEAMELRPDLAVDPNGDAVAVWQRVNGGEVTIEAASKPAGGGWAAPEALSNTADMMHPAQVSIDAAGDATAVWEDKQTGEGLIDAASKPGGGKWQSAVALSAPGENANEPRVAVNAQGEAVAVWERPNAKGVEVIEATTKPASGSTWAMPTALTDPATTREPANQEVAIDRQGDVVAVWSRLKGGTSDVVEATERPASSAVWQAPVALSALGGNVEEKPQLAIDEQGDVVAVWERFDGVNEIVEAVAGHAPEATWQTPVALSAGGQDAAEPAVALDGQGDAAAVWRRLDEKGSYVAEAAGYDAAGPTLHSLLVPSVGTVGQPLSFSTSPFDVWSALGATEWSFGDAAGQAGTSVTHTYDAPGVYSVSVTSVDLLGNATSASAAVPITAAPASASVGPRAAAPVAPRITRARLTRSRFRVSARATAISAANKLRQGTSFQFALSEAAGLRVVFKRSAAGLRRGKRCLAPSAKLSRAHAKRCTRTLTVGTLTRSRERAGLDSLVFSGRIGTKALHPGTYEASLTASADGLSSRAVTLLFTVVR